jgi:hypothetical protein
MIALGRAVAIKSVSWFCAAYPSCGDLGVGDDSVDISRRVAEIEIVQIIFSLK